VLPTLYDITFTLLIRVYVMCFLPILVLVLLVSSRLRAVLPFNVCCRFCTYSSCFCDVLPSPTVEIPGDVFALRILVVLTRAYFAQRITVEIPEDVSP
jgi:hypothetical protein